MTLPLGVGAAFGYWGADRGVLWWPLLGGLFTLWIAGVLAMIGWICRQLVVAGDLVEARVPRKEAMQGIAGRWQQRGAILDRASRASRSALAQNLIGCAEADLFIKRMRDARLGADRLRTARGRLEALCRQICAA